MSKFYQHTLPQPYHVSAGAVLFDDSGKVCLHHFYIDVIPPQFQFLHDNLPELYLLMRESLEDDETLIGAVVRGLREEFGAEAIVEKYLGGIETDVITPTKTFQKVTLYHAARLTALGDRTDIGEEAKSLMEWHTPAEALALFERQATLTARPELHEAEIIRRFMRAYDIS